MSADDPTTARDRGWDRGYEGHADAQRRRIAALPLWLKIEWLEEMQRLIAHMDRSDLPKSPDDSSS